jgi:hypothetical protein
VLRVLSVIIPLLFGFALRFVTHHGLRSAVFIGAATGIIAVVGMLVVVGLIEKVFILPENARDWRETIEYMTALRLLSSPATFSRWQFFRVLPKTMAGERKLNPLATRLAA